MTNKHDPIETFNKDELEKQNFSLKGTFIMVMLLGVFLIISWASIYLIFILR